MFYVYQLANESASLAVLYACRAGQSGAFGLHAVRSQRRGRGQSESCSPAICLLLFGSRDNEERLHQARALDKCWHSASVKSDANVSQKSH